MNGLMKWGACFLAVLASVCLTAEAASSNSSAIFGSSLDGAAFNGITYILGEREVQVIVPVNASTLNLSLSDRAQNMTLLDGDGRQVEFNSSYRYWRGDHIYSLAFAGHVRGRLIYTIPSTGQQFILPIREKVPVRIVLPPGYTTGEKALGIASPEPDEFEELSGRTALTWNNTTAIPYIEVNYYRRSAPRALAIIFSILGLAGAMLLVQYYLSTRRLKRFAEDPERVMK